MYKLKPLGGVLWDLDGTIADTEIHWLRAEQSIAKAAAVSWSQALQQQLVGATLEGAAAVLHAAGAGSNESDVVQQLAEAVSTLDWSSVSWRPGAVELLQELKLLQIPCVMVTMSSRAEALAALEHLPRGTFVDVVSADDVTSPKPHPLPYQMGLEALDVSADLCVAIEDSPVGVESALGAGVRTVAVPQLLEVRPGPGCIVLDSLEGVTPSFLENFLHQPRPIAKHNSAPIANVGVKV